MALEDTQPTNTNFLSPLGFRFQLKRAPTVMYFCQSTSLPDLSLGNVNRETPFVNTPYAGDKLEFAPFTIRFGVDEDMKNYLEIFNWMKGLGFPEKFQQYRDEVGAPNDDSTLGQAKNTVSDSTLTILTANHNPNVHVFFKDMFPIDLSGLEFNTTQTNVAYLEATATFQYREFTLETV